jgi:hypothetical protein
VYEYVYEYGWRSQPHTRTHTRTRESLRVSYAIEHRTFNIERPTSKSGADPDFGVRCWMFCVRCSWTVCYDQNPMQVYPIRGPHQRQSAFISGFRASPHSPVPRFSSFRATICQILAHDLLITSGMSMKIRFLGLAAGVAVTICTGCATNYTAMMRVTPTQAWDSRSADELFMDLNRAAPFPVAAGDFVINKANDGPSCWICLDDPAKTKLLLKSLRSNPDWKVTSVGKVNRQSRTLFGLAPEAGSAIPGRTQSVYEPTIMASR